LRCHHKLHVVTVCLNLCLFSRQWTCWIFSD